MHPTKPSTHQREKPRMTNPHPHPDVRVVSVHGYHPRRHRGLPARLADDTGQGKTTISAAVVQKIAGIAAREISGAPGTVVGVRIGPFADAPLACRRGRGRLAVAYGSRTLRELASWRQVLTTQAHAIAVGFAEFTREATGKPTGGSTGRAPRVDLTDHGPAG
jgi:hypothetical protein